MASLLVQFYYVFKVILDDGNFDAESTMLILYRYIECIIR